MENKTKVIILASIFIAPLLLYILLGNVLTLINRSLPNQTRFDEGRIPEEFPDGKYNGTAVTTLNWTGKSFNSANQTGINNFQGGSQMFPFRTYVEKSVSDDKEVIVIDYNIPENPFFIRWVRDEIVEVEPGEFLGKAHFRMLPFVPFTIIYFELSHE